MKLDIRTKLVLVSLGLIAASIFVLESYLRPQVEAEIVAGLRTDLFARLALMERDVSALGAGAPDSAWDALAAKLGTHAAAHLVLDTGMGRMGFPSETWDETRVRELQNLAHVRWEGLASHLPSADEDREFTAAQIEQFHKAVAAAHNAGLQPKWIHLDNSSGLLGGLPARMSSSGSMTPVPVR